jgi:hypothetical protein
MREFLTLQSPWLLGEEQAAGVGRAGEEAVHCLRHPLRKRGGIGISRALTFQRMSKW